MENTVNRVYLPTGIFKLDKTLDGGIDKGEPTLLVGATGSGKTVFVCQVGNWWARGGRKGVIISTEHAGKALEARIVSNIMRVPFQSICRGVHLGVLSKDQTDGYHQLREVFSKTLKLVSWPLGAGVKTIKADLHAAIEAAGAELGGLDFVMFDYLNNQAAGIHTAADAQASRFMYQTAADMFASIVRGHNLAGVLCVQANPSTSKNKIAIDASLASDCKTMDQSFDNVIGITARLNIDQNVDDEDVYLAQQYLYISKRMRGGKIAVPVVRKFEFQMMGGPY